MVNGHLAIDLVELMAATPWGSVASVDVDGVDEAEFVQRWAAASGNYVLMVHADRVELLRGIPPDPLEALAPERRPGHRLWVYTNFNCNLACDYCCVESSPRADPRAFGVAEFRDLVAEAAACGVRELFLTGGEPFMLVDLDERICVGVAAMPTTVLTNAMLWRGERLRLLERLPRDGLTLQISVDSPDPGLHDLHRGSGSFERALAGIEVALALGFRVRIAATLGDDVGDGEARLRSWFDRLGLAEDCLVVRRVARQGAANSGLVMSRSSLLPEICVTADGLWWHPVAAIDPAMRVSASWRPLAERIGEVSREYRGYRLAGEIAASSFPCA